MQNAINLRNQHKADRSILYFKENYLLIRNNGSKYKNKTKLFKTLQ